MTPDVSPAIAGWVSQPGDEFRLAEVVVRRGPAGFALRHQDDAMTPDEQLRELPPDALREWAGMNEAGMFRPNRTAPGLRRGWRTLTTTAAELETALEGLYPGAIADWFAVHSGTATITSFREFTGRQTGMYRAVSELDDARAVQVVRAGCDSGCCLRRRLWTVSALPVDEAGEKSGIPCLEPCALLLEFARRAQQLERDPAVPIPLRAGEVATLRACIDHALNRPDTTVREGDTASPLNPRRLRLLRNQLSQPGGIVEKPPKES